MPSDSAADDVAALIERLVADNVDAVTAAAAADTGDGAEWSAREVLGHLVDSTQVNIQRIVRAQCEEAPHIVYEQDAWVRLQRYGDAPAEELATLWLLLNRHLCRLVRDITPDVGRLVVDLGKQGPDPRDLSFVATDYVRHLRVHLAQLGVA